MQKEDWSRGALTTQLSCRAGGSNVISRNAAMPARSTSSADSTLAPGNIAQQSHHRFLELLVQGRRINAPEVGKLHHTTLVRKGNFLVRGLLDRNGPRVKEPEVEVTLFLRLSAFVPEGKA